MTPLSLQLARHAAQTRFDRLPEAAVGGAKRSIVDTLAVSWAATTAPGCPEVHGLYAQRGGQAESSAWGRRGRMPAASAAAVNGIASAALDYDTMHGGFHADGCVLAAALPMAERQGRSGSELLRAFVLGVDVASRIAAACQVRTQGWWDTPVMAGFGAAVAAGLLLELDESAIAHAMGLVYARTGGTLQLNVDQSLAKRLAAGQAAEAGVNAALLAAAGITGPARIFEGEFGFSRVYAPIDSRKLLDGLGSRFASAEMTFKPHPSCGCTHTAIQAASDLMRELRLGKDDVREVVVRVSPYMHALVGGEFDPQGGQVAAQFNVRYAVACAIHRGGFTLSDLEPGAMAEPAVVRTVRKVSVEIDESSDSARACSLVFVTADGQSHRRVQEIPPGAPAAPMSAEAHRAKVDDCFGRGMHPLGREKADALVRMLEGLEGVASASDMMKEFERAID